MIAVPSGVMAYCASIRRIRASRVGTESRVACVALQNASSIPSPPSETESTLISASSSWLFKLSATAFPASSEVRLPLKESIATIYLM